MSSGKVRVAVIGCGVIGKNHIKRYNDIEGAELVAVCDLDGDEARRVAGEHGVAEACTDYRELLDREDIAAVDVCLHNQFHAPVSIAAMRAGKDVYCEKPIAGTYADGRAMLDAAQQTGRKVHIQIASIFGAPAQAARRAIEAGELGEIYHARAYVNLGRTRPFVDGKNTAQFVRKATAAGGALIDWGIYVICPMLYLMGNPRPLRITGQTYDKVPMDPQLRAQAKYDVEELGAGFVHFDTGATLDICAAWAMHSTVKIPGILAGTNAGIELSPMPGKAQAPKLISTITDPWTNRELDVEGLQKQWDEAGLGDAYASPQHHWVRVLQGRVPLEPTAQTALNMMLIAEGIYRSAAEQREVRAEEIIVAAQRSL